MFKSTSLRNILARSLWQLMVLDMMDGEKKENDKEKKKEE